MHMHMLYGAPSMLLHFGASAVRESPTQLLRLRQRLMYVVLATKHLTGGGLPKSTEGLPNRVCVLQPRFGRYSPLNACVRTTNPLGRPPNKVCHVGGMSFVFFAGFCSRHFPYNTCVRLQQTPSDLTLTSSRFSRQRKDEFYDRGGVFPLTCFWMTGFLNP